MEKTTNSNTLTSFTRIELVEGYFDNNSQYWSEGYLKPQYVNDFVLIHRNKIAVDFWRIGPKNHLMALQPWVSCDTRRMSAKL